MKILGLGVPELVVILVVVLVIFGPKNLPKLGASLGKTVKNVREGMESDDPKVEGDTTDAADEVIVSEDADVDADTDAADEGATDTVFCGSCGTSNPAGNAFCSKCGAKLNSGK